MKSEIHSILVKGYCHWLEEFKSQTLKTLGLKSATSQFIHGSLAGVFTKEVWCWWNSALWWKSKISFRDRCKFVVWIHVQMTLSSLSQTFITITHEFNERLALYWQKKESGQDQETSKCVLSKGEESVCVYCRGAVLQLAVPPERLFSVSRSYRFTVSTKSFFFSDSVAPSGITTPCILPVNSSICFICKHSYSCFVRNVFIYSKFSIFMSSRYSNTSLGQVETSFSPV